MTRASINRSSLEKLVGPLHEKAVDILIALPSSGNGLYLPEIVCKAPGVERYSEEYRSIMSFEDIRAVNINALAHGQLSEVVNGMASSFRAALAKLEKGGLVSAVGIAGDRRYSITEKGTITMD